MDIVISNRFERSIRRISSTYREKIKEAIEELRLGTNRGKKLDGRLRDFYSLRIGPYRIIYQIFGNTIKLSDVGHRQNVYD